MSYEKQSWSSGDVVTSSKLNHIESGIEEASSANFFVATYTKSDDTWGCDKTLAEILAAIEAGKSVWAYNSDDESYMRLDSFVLDGDGKNVLFAAFGMESDDDAESLWFMTLNHYGSGIDYRYEEANVPKSEA